MYVIFYNCMVLYTCKRLRMKGINTMKLDNLYIKTLELELEYLNNPNQETAKKYNKAKNELCKNQKFYKAMLKTNIVGLK